ncbi:MAG: hypothetical protein IJU79_00020 [Desulfovibrionaceae bacterium]|nr:hypothetical protein [Desulfovibrionaceae bacterium]
MGGISAKSSRDGKCTLLSSVANTKDKHFQYNFSLSSKTKPEKLAKLAMRNTAIRKAMEAENVYAQSKSCNCV